MKRILINSWPAIVLLFIVASCGKEVSVEDKQSQYFIKCKIGGADKTFNVAAAASKQDLGSGVTSYSIFGKSMNDASNLESIGFTIQFSIPVANTTYKETDPTTDYFLAGIYNPNTTVAEQIFASRYAEDNPFQITFTEVTETSISGQFSGKLFVNNTDPNADSAVLSNGSFKVKVQK